MSFEREVVMRCWPGGLTRFYAILSVFSGVLVLSLFVPISITTANSVGIWLIITICLAVPGVFLMCLGPMLLRPVVLTTSELALPRRMRATTRLPVSCIAGLCLLAPTDGRRWECQIWKSDGECFWSLQLSREIARLVYKGDLVPKSIGPRWNVDPAQTAKVGAENAGEPVRKLYEAILRLQGAAGALTSLRGVGDIPQSLAAESAFAWLPIGPVGHFEVLQT